MLGLSFEVVPANIDETPLVGEAPAALAGRLALGKAELVARHYPHALVVAADTVVALDGRLLEKPASEEENREFARLLSGREHDVFTGHALMFDGRRQLAVVRSGVRFRPLAEGEISWYAATGEGRDKAAATLCRVRGGAGREPERLLVERRRLEPADPRSGRAQARGAACLA